MTIQELLNLLQDTLRKLNEKNIDDENKIELEILVLQLKREMLVKSFDPLKELDEFAVPDVSNLERLTAEVEREIQNEQLRIQLVQRIYSIAKQPLRASGVPLPF